MLRWETGLKYLLVIVMLPSWSFAQVFFLADDTHARLILTAVAAGFLLAILLLALSSLTKSERPAFGLGTIFVLCGPPTLAAMVALGFIVDAVNFRGYGILCVPENRCLTIETARQFSRWFSVNFVAYTAAFYLIIFTAAFFIRLIQGLERKFYDRMFARRERP